MGTFLTYRLAGGQPGVRISSINSGLTLELPRTRLTDIPVLDEPVIDEIVATQTNGLTDAARLAYTGHLPELSYLHISPRDDTLPREIGVAAYYVAAVGLSWHTVPPAGTYQQRGEPRRLRVGRGKVGSPAK